MNTPAQLHHTVTKDNVNLEVLNLFEKLTSDKSYLLFSITSDIDHLGNFVARYGRALAQNLVDYSTNLMIQFINSDKNIIGSDNIVLIPAGEEITMLGIGSSDVDIKNFYILLHNTINEKIIAFEPDKQKVSVTFGIKIITDPMIHREIESMIKSIKMSKDYSSTMDYYSILYKIRSLVSLSVDSGKFKSLVNSNDGHIIFLRNVVYSEVLEYKSKTARILKALSNNFGSVDIPEKFTKQYGLNVQEHKLIKKIYNQLDMDK